MTLDGAAMSSGGSNLTVPLWYSNCRAVCTATESVLPKMTGMAVQPIQIDESYFQGRTKCNRCKCSLGGITIRGEQEARAEMGVEVVKADVHETGDECEVDEVPVRIGCYWYKEQDRGL